MKLSIMKICLTACLLLLPSAIMAAEAPTSAPPIADTIPTPATPTVTGKLSRIGFVDISYIGMESEFGKSVKAQLIEKKEKAEAKILAEKKKLDTLKESIEAKLPTYSPKQREAKSKEFQKKVEAFQKMLRESEETFMKDQERETGKVFNLIEKVIADYGKANDFAMIAVKKNILYEGAGVDPQDLTSIILKSVNDAWKSR